MEIKNRFVWSLVAVASLLAALGVAELFWPHLMKGGVPVCNADRITYVDSLPPTPYGGGHGILSFTTEGGCQPEIISYVPWISVTAKDGVATFVIAPNTGLAREGTFKVHDNVVKIRQRAAPAMRGKPISESGGPRARGDGPQNHQKNQQHPKGGKPAGFFNLPQF